MAWFLALQGPPNKTGQSPTYELQESADITQISEEMATAAATDRAVPIPALFKNGTQQVTLYVRPAAWGAWAFYEMSDEERREIANAASAASAATNPLINAIAQARAAKQQQTQLRPQQPAGPSVLPRLD